MTFALSSTPHVVVLVLLMGSLGLAFALYLTRYPALSPRRRALLVATRTLTLLGLLFATFAPVVRYSSASRERNRVLILVDHSGSMEVRDGDRAGRTRREVADSAAVAIATQLAGRYDVRLAPFDAALGPIGKPGSWKEAARTRGAGETALGDAIGQALDRVDPDSVAALLILSDGAVNRGEDPERALQAIVPAFVLVAGSSSDPPTTGIGGVDAPSEVVLGRPATLTVTVRHGARPAARGVARLSEGGRELGRAPFALERPGSMTRVTIPFTLAERGKHFLTVRLDSLPGDPITQNKRRLVPVTARPAKRVVPLLASAWDWDLRSYSRGVEEDTAWAIQRYLPTGSAGVAAPGGAAKALSQVLRDADVAVVRYDSRTITPDRAAELLRFLERGGGLLLWTDPQMRPPAESPLSRALGLAWRDFNRLPGPSTSVDLTPPGRGHEISLLGGDAATATAAWRSLPPIQTPVVLGVKGTALAPLLEARFGQEGTPILLAGRVAAGRVAILNATGVYRWGLTAAGLGGGAGIEPTFFGGLNTWLAQSADDRPVRLSVPDLTPAERPVPVRVALSGAPPTSGARARVQARRVGGGGPGGETILEVSPQGDFAGSLALPEGIYTLVGRVERGGRVIGLDSVRVAVGEQGVEFESLRSEPSIMERLATRSGGVSAPLTSPGPVLAKLNSPDIAKAKLIELDLFHNVALFLVLVLGATAEWILRKRFHLL